MDLSLFERMVHAREKEFGRSGAMENGSLVTLETQRRMRPEISNLIRIPIYPNLQDALEVLDYPNVQGMTPPLFYYCSNTNIIKEWRGIYGFSITQMLRREEKRQSLDLM